MGTPIPPVWEDLEDTKYYCITMHQFGVGDLAQTCADPFDRVVNCCKTGAAIKAWLAAGNECQPYHNLCASVGNYGQRLVEAKGPYDTAVACAADCP